MRKLRNWLGPVRPHAARRRVGSGTRLLRRGLLTGVNGAAAGRRRQLIPVLGVLASLGIPLLAAGIPSSTSDMQLWVWPVLLFVFCFGIGVVAPLTGVGGGVLYVPLVSAFFPFHIDFVRAAGLLVAMSGALAAGPHLLRCGLADLRLALPVSLIAASSAVLGAHIGLALATHVVQLLLGVLVIVVASVTMMKRNLETPLVQSYCRLGTRLGLGGQYTEQTSGASVEWRTHRTALGLLSFVLVGLVAGMFGLGAGWANVPVLNLVMGVPLKVATGTSNFLIAYTGASAGWVYLHRGAFLPFIVVPSIAGLMAGASLGARLLPQTRPRVIRVLVIVVLLFAGAKMLFEGLTG